MKCPNCKSVLSLKNNRCERCGEDIRVYKRIVKASNACYNQGLMKAKVRDLSGAVEALRRSLELDKNNTNARNLLGLVYYEMGETVAALSEWVISKHLQKEDNDADEFMNMVQSNPTKLDHINQAIKKYNQALTSAKQGSPDLAIIQLKKVVTLNPKFIRAFQLLTLLYMQSGEKDKAIKMIMKANAIDVNNTVTLRYMKELGVSGGRPIREVKDYREEKKEKKEVYDSKTVERNVFRGMQDFKEDKPSIWLYLNLVIGVVVGVIAYHVLIGPNVSNKTVKELQQTVADFQGKNSALETQLDKANEKVTSYEEQIKQLQGQVVAENPDATVDPNATPAPNVSSGNIVTGDQAIALLLQSASYALDKDNENAAKTLTSVTEESFTTEPAKELYNIIKESTFETVAKKLYTQGYNKYDSRKYEDAIELLVQATALNDDYEDAIYFLGRSYHQIEQYDKARECYQYLIDNHPTSRRGTQAKSKIKTLPETTATVAPSETPLPSETPMVMR